MRRGGRCWLVARLCFPDCGLMRSLRAHQLSSGSPIGALQLEIDDGSGFRHVAHATERSLTVQALRSGILYK